MRIYRLDYKLVNSPAVDSNPAVNGYPNALHTEWFTSERTAVVRRLELYKGGKLLGKKKDAEVWGVEVPTKKAELVEWLNANWGE